MKLIIRGIYSMETIVRTTRPGGFSRPIPIPFPLPMPIPAPLTAPTL